MTAIIKYKRNRTKKTLEYNSDFFTYVNFPLRTKYFLFFLKFSDTIFKTHTT